MTKEDPENIWVTAALSPSGPVTETKLSLGRGALHRLAESKQCNHLYRSVPGGPRHERRWWGREFTTLKEAAEGSHHHLCETCEWPDGALDVLREYGEPQIWLEESEKGSIIDRMRCYFHD